MAASYDRDGAVIYYNPRFLDKVPSEVEEFLRAHEYGHHLLAHIPRLRRQSDPYRAIHLSREQELEADCFAAQVVDKHVAERAADFLENTQGPFSLDIRHPPGATRAAEIRACADEAISEEFEAPYDLNNEIADWMDAMRADPALALGRMLPNQPPGGLATKYASAIPFLEDSRCEMEVRERSSGVVYEQRCTWENLDAGAQAFAHSVFRRVLVLHFPTLVETRVHFRPRLETKFQDGFKARTQFHREDGKSVLELRLTYIP